ncbi:hypothetical protein CGCF413_v015163 [Colletotrichum fructicola]|nr:hypothetical protein CGCF413_v015163 [Colletotrichum fructicola]
MPPAKPGSLGLLLLFHTTRALYTLIAHSLYIIQTNLHLCLYLARTVAVCFSIFAPTFLHVGQICSTAVEGALATWTISLSVVFVWAVPYAIFLSGVFSVAVFVVVLEQCETVYLILRSFLRGTEAPVSPEAASPARQSLAPLDHINDATQSQPELSQPQPQTSVIRQFHRPGPASHHQKTPRGSRMPRSTRGRAPTPGPDGTMEKLQQGFGGRVGSEQFNEPRFSPEALPGLNDRHVLGEISHTNTDSARLPFSASHGHFGDPRRLPKPPSTGKATGHSAASHARRISAGFSHGGPLSSNPTVASFDVNALTGAAARNDENQPPLSKSGEVTFTSSSESSPSLAPSSGIQSKFNSRPSSRVEKKRIPKSRTMTVLSNLTASLSRTSLTSFTSDRKASTSRSVSSRKVSGSSTSTLSTTDTSRVPTPMSAEVNPLIINTAQSSQYWAGRFQSLHDRFHNEDLQPHSLGTLVSAHASRSTVVRDQRAAYQSRGNLPLSTTTALDRYSTTAVSRETKVLDEEDNRCLRVFLHLDSLCATPEAQKSLHAWQEIYARRNNRVALLPHGASMDKGFVARIFGGGRRSMGAPRPEKQVIEGKYRTGKRVSML